jgi:SpoOM protein
MAWLIKGLVWLLLGVLALVATIWWVWNTGLGLFWPFVGLVVAGISLHRSHKAFVEFWRSRISEKVEIQVTAEKDTYLPGDVVNVSVRVTGKEDLDIQECRVALVCANRYIYRYTTRDSDGDSDTRSMEVTEEVEAGNERILDEGTIVSGSYTGRDLVLKIPLTAPPSASGEITNVEWKVRVALLIRGAPDVIEELPLTVLSTSESYANWAENAPELDSSGVCDMEFRLPSRSLRIGERIEGPLVLTPRQDFEARSLRVELVRREIVPRASGNTSETVQASEVVDESPRFQMGLSRDYAFAMDVPGAAGPSLKTEQTYVGWWLRAVVDRGLAFDYDLKQLLNVYNGPAITTDSCPECGTKIPQGAGVCANCGATLSQDDAPMWTRQDAPPRTLPTGEAPTASENPQHPPGSGAPQAPPSGPSRTHRKVVLFVFAGVAGLILISFLIIGLFFLLLLFA